MQRLRIATFCRWVACGFLALGWCLGIALFLVSGYVRDPGLVLDLARATPEALEGTISADDQASVWWAYEFALKCPELIALRNATQGDPRIVGVIGFGLFFPGLPGSSARLGQIDLCGDSVVRVSGGVGDCGTRYDFLYQAAFYNYALRYNRAIWPFLRATYPDRRFGMELSWGEAALFSSQGPWTALPPGGVSGGVRQAAVEVLRFGANNHVHYLKGTLEEMPGGRRTFVGHPEALWTGSVRPGPEGALLVQFRDYRSIRESPAYGTDREERLLVVGSELLWRGRTFNRPSWLYPEDFEGWFNRCRSRPDAPKSAQEPLKPRTYPEPVFSGTPDLPFEIKKHG